MKYIRTKNDTIYQVYDKVFEYKEDKRYQLADSRFEISLNDVVKEADNIEELCDGFIFKDTKANELHCVFKGKADGMSILGAALFTETLRFFIETDKGLIYVAKMNDKGELELL